MLASSLQEILSNASGLAVMLFAGILIGYVLLRVTPDLAFPALAVAIGARYFSFLTIYGEPAYWMLGAVMAVIGTLAMVIPTSLPLEFPLLVGFAECTFAALLFMRWRRRRQQDASGPTARLTT